MRKTALRAGYADAQPQVGAPGIPDDRAETHADPVDSGSAVVGVVRPRGRCKRQTHFRGRPVSKLRVGSAGCAGGDRGGFAVTRAVRAAYCAGRTRRSLSPCRPGAEQLLAAVDAGISRYPLCRLDEVAVWN